MAFTNAEKARIRYHLGYLGVQLAGSVSFGLPRPIQTNFIVEDAMNMVISEHEGQVRTMVARCDVTEERIFQAQGRLKAESLGEIKLRADECDALEKEYGRWARRLADILGVPLYAFSSKFQGAGGAGGAGNIPVIG